MNSAVIITKDYAFQFDNIGNRERSQTLSGGGGVTNTYQANLLNQYTNIFNGVTNEPTYDPDGNMLTYDGWTYTWNGENRMVGASNESHQISWAYDYMGRCFEKVKDGVTNSFTWDGYNIIQEFQVSGFSSQICHNVWGLDLSGDLQGAGGVGGLLGVVQDGEEYFTCMDGNGNITAYVDDSGTVVASREYSPFGVTISLTGSKQNDFTHWWSTKPWDPITGLSEYEYRKYRPELGRWLNRDPINELGLLTVTDMTMPSTLILVSNKNLLLYLFIVNNTINLVDTDGRDIWPPSSWPILSHRRRREQACRAALAMAASSALTSISPPTCCSMAATQGVISQQIAESLLDGCVSGQPGSCREETIRWGFFVCPDSEREQGTIGIYFCIPLD